MFFVQPNFCLVLKRTYKWHKKLRYSVYTCRFNNQVSNGTLYKSILVLLRSRNIIVYEGDRKLENAILWNSWEDVGQKYARWKEALESRRL